MTKPPINEVIALALGYLVFFIAGPALMLVIAYFFPITFLPSLKVGLLPGAMSSGFGAVLVIWSNIELYRKGHGGAAVIGRIRISKPTDTLVTSGPYALCRNPMHLGLTLFYLGLSCAINSLSSLIVPVLTLAFAYISAVYFDEPRLRQDFTESYAAWSAEVPRFLPVLRRKKP